MGFISDSISGTTISGGTFYGDGRNLQGVPKYYAEPSTPPTVSPIVNGVNGIAIGDSAKSTSESFVVGSFAGPSVTSGHTGSTMIGYYAGNSADLAYNSVFIGYNSGYNAFNSFNSNFIGKDAGKDNYEGYNANFIGVEAGLGSEARFANFVGFGAGKYALALYGNSIGYKAGSESDPLPGGGGVTFDSSYSNLIGFRAGQSFSGTSANAIGNNDIIIGTNISLPSGVSNSINIGGVLFGINTYSTTTGNPSIVPTTNGKIGIGVVTPSNRLHVEDTTDPLRLVGLQTLNTDSEVLTTDTNGVIHKRPYDYVTGFTYSSSSSTFTIRTSSGNTFNANINTMTGLTVNGDIAVTGNLIVSGNTIVSGDTRISGTTSLDVVPNATGDFLTIQTNDIVSRRTSDQVRDDIGYYGLTFAISNGYY
jgi:hypothetical protein